MTEESEMKNNVSVECFGQQIFCKDGMPAAFFNPIFRGTNIILQNRPIDNSLDAHILQIKCSMKRCFIWKSQIF